MTEIMDPFVPYTLEGERNTFGYTVLFPVEVVSQRIFIGWMFFPRDSGHVGEVYSFGKKAISAKDVEELTKYSRWHLTDHVSQDVLGDMIDEIFEYYRGEA